MPDIGASQGMHQDVFLTNISIAYRNKNYIADQVFPVMPVKKRSGKYQIYNANTFLRSSGLGANGKPASTRRPGARSERVQWDVSNQPYYCEQIARNYPILDEERNYADSPLSIDVDSTESVTATVMLDNEIAVAGKAMTRANYAAANKAQLVTGTTSWAAPSSKPISVDLQNGKKAVLKGIQVEANTVLMDYDAATTLSQNQEYVTRIQYTSKETVTKSGLLPYVAGLEVMVASGQVVTSAENASPATTGYIWQDDQGQDAALVFYKNPAPGLKMVALGLTFSCPDDTTGSEGFAVIQWREAWINATVVEVRTTRDYRFTSTDGSTNGDGGNGYAKGGYLISGTNL